MAAGSLGTCGSWHTDVYARVVSEAEAEGAAGLADLRRREDRYRLGTALLAGRVSAGLTQRQLAAVSGVRQSELSPIEAGNANPTLQTLGALARALRIEIHIGRPDSP